MNRVIDGHLHRQLGVLAVGLGGITASAGMQCPGPVFPGQKYRVGDRPLMIVLGDLDGIGGLDALVAIPDDNDISVLLSGSGGSWAALSAYEVGTFPLAVTLGDLDGDGDTDVVVANTANWNIPGDISVLLNEGGGVLSEETRYDVGYYPLALALGDLDGDGIVDIAVANGEDSDISVLLGEGDGTFADDYRVSAGDAPFGLSLGDVDGDGDLDMAVADWSNDTANVLMNNGDGTFSVEVCGGPLTADTVAV